MPNITIDPDNPKKNFMASTTVPRAKARLAGKTNPNLKVTKKGASDPVYNQAVGADDQNLPQLEDSETYTAEGTFQSGQNITITY